MGWRFEEGSLGGIFWLSRIVVRDRTELLADFREFYSTSPDHVPAAEFWLLVKALMADPRSRVQAVEAGWDNPVSREAIVLYDLFDLTLRAHLERRQDFRPYPRPWRPNVRRSRLTPKQARAILKK